jgi:two-component system, NarL family, nitrate/nitrite response regulator NarL
MLTMRDPNQGPIRVLALADPGLGARTLERLREAQSEGLWLMGNASSLEDAVALIVTTDPQVIVIDVDGEYGPDTIADLGERSDARLIALTCSRDAELQDGAILAGARGVVEKRQAAEFLVAAIRCVHEGEMWINHAAADRILDELAHARKRAEQQERIRVKLSRLTLKERIIATEITRSDSATPREIAARLQISEHRLQVYLAAIQRKLELSDGEARMSGSQPRSVTRQPDVVRAQSPEVRSKPAPSARPSTTGVACLIAGETTAGDAPRPGDRGQDPIVFPSGPAYAEAIRFCRWRRLRRTT